MMFDLATKWTETIICEPVAAKIARRQNLELYEIYIGLLVEDGHTNVVRRNDHAQVQAKQHLMNNHEEHGLNGGETIENETKVENEMHA